MNRKPPHAPDQRYAAARRERRERNRKKPDILGAIRVVVALLVVAQCIRVAFTSPRLRLREVRVTGTQRLTPEQVRLLGEIPLGRNIFGCNLAQVSRRLRRDPEIKETFVTRELPNTIHATIHERVPALQLTAGVQRFDADEEGFVFRKSEALIPGLPLLQTPADKLPGVGQRLDGRVAKAVWECDQLAGEQGLKLRNLRVDEGGELWLNVETDPARPGLPRTLAVRLGEETDLPEKFRDIQNSMSWPELTAKATYLDVMCAGSPVYMSKRETTEATASH